MKKALLPALVVLGLCGGTLVGAHGVDAAWSSAYADGQASVDAGPSPDASPSAIPDPVADPSGAASTVWEIWKGARLPAIVLAGFLLAAFIHRKKWLSGRWAFYVGSVVAAGGVIAERAAAGDAPSVALLVQFLGTVGLAIMKFEFGGKEQA